MKTSGSSRDDLPMKAPAIEVHDLTVAYHHQPVLWDIDLKLPAGHLPPLSGWDAATPRS